MTLTFSLTFQAGRKALGFAISNFWELARLLWLPMVLQGVFWTLLNFSVQWNIAANIWNSVPSADPMSDYLLLSRVALVGAMISLVMIWMAVVRLRCGLPVSKGWAHFTFKWPEGRFLVLLVFAVLGVFLILNPSPFLQRSLSVFDFFKEREPLAEIITISFLGLAVSIWLTGLLLGPIVIAKEKRFALWRSLTLTFPHLLRLWITLMVGCLLLLIPIIGLLLLGEMVGLSFSMVFLPSDLLDEGNKRTLYWGLYGIRATFNAFISALLVICIVAFAAEIYERLTQDQRS